MSALIEGLNKILIDRYIMLNNMCGCWSCSEIVTALSQVDLGIEELREKKDKIKKVMQLEEEEKANIQRELAALTKRLAVIDESLSQKYAYVEEYDKTIQDVESAYSKVWHSLTFGDLVHLLHGTGDQELESESPMLSQAQAFLAD